MQILVTNDDGINSEGLWALARELKGVEQITVVAPDREQSAIGTAINQGSNLGEDVHISGTVGAALQGYISITPLYFSRAEKPPRHTLDSLGSDLQQQLRKMIN